MKQPSRLRVEDWSRLPAGALDLLYEEECRRWTATIDWDFAPSVRMVEQARIDGRLPGFVARAGDGHVTGWCFFVLHEGLLQIGGLAGETSEVLGGLLRAVLGSSHARASRGVTCFLFPGSPSTRRALERHQFALERHVYLTREQPAGGPPAGPGEPLKNLRWLALAEVDPIDLARLLASAFAGQADARCYAPDGRLDQWAHYVAQLLRTPACGRYLPDASFALTAADGRLVGAVLTTAVGSRTAHLAQVVVHPEWQGRGLGRRLVEAGSAAASTLGYPIVSLLVAHSNTAALSLYTRLGFQQRSGFLYGRRSAVCSRAA